MSIYRVWHYLLVEPFTWIFCSLFQPLRFKNSIDSLGYFRWNRLFLALRIIMPLFICTLPLMLVGWYLSFKSYHFRIVGFDGVINYYVPSVFWLFLQTAIISMLTSLITGIARAIALTLTLNVGYSISLLFFHIYHSFFFPLAFWGFIGGVVLGTIVGKLDEQENAVGDITLVCSLFIMVLLDILLKNILVLFIFPQLIIYMLIFALMNIISFISWYFIKKSFTVNTIGKALTWGLTYGIYATVIFNIVGNSASGSLFRPISMLAFLVSVFVFGSFCLACYLVGSSRLLLYPFSGLSTLWAYLVSRRHPEQVFVYLHRSALYWDEYVFLPLLCLRSLLLLATEQDQEGTRIMQEITFVLTKRPQQLAAVKAVSYELALRRLEACHSLEQIADVHRTLTQILPSEAIDPQWIKPFALFIEMSRDADRYNTPTSRQLRGKALEKLWANLEEASKQVAFKDSRLNVRMHQITLYWQSLVGQEVLQFRAIVQTMGYLDNSYAPGQVLGRDDQFFVGRQDLVQRIAEALSRGQFHPPFLLNGEQRMGKSSLLRHLSLLLDSSYIPVFCDLQMGGVTSSAATLLASVAHQIGEALLARGLKAGKLEYLSLQDAARSNEAAAYYLFNQWYRTVEQRLEQRDCTVLLTFDEFEQLESARQAGYLDLEVLLDWLRSLLQNAPRLAILFSGADLIQELGPTWVSHFVGVQTLKVSFLRPAEARQLIMYANKEQEIFSLDIIEEIVRVSACQPFLVQALCSALIDTLNAEERTQAEWSDLLGVREQVLQDWSNSYFQGLWQRTDESQRYCLRCLQMIGAGSFAQLAQQSNLNESTLQHALHRLLQRDLVVQQSDGTYRIAIPIFQQWLEQRQYI